MIGILIACLIIAAAAAILFARMRRFIRTKGQSACDSCPYSGGCRGCGSCTKP